jgi:signal transduction histidine kinase
VGIILGHLVQNAIQATPRRKAVRLMLHGGHHGVRFEVRDEGTGFPEEMRPLLFKPCLSSKEGGSGLGLALCRQLAAHLDAELELVQSTPQGCVFVLTLPEHPTSDSVTESRNPLAAQADWVIKAN